MSKYKYPKYEYPAIEYAEKALAALIGIVNYEGIVLNEATTLRDVIEIDKAITKYGVVEVERYVDTYGPNNFDKELGYFKRT